MFTFEQQNNKLYWHFETRYSPLFIEFTEATSITDDMSMHGQKPYNTYYHK